MNAFTKIFIFYSLLLSCVVAEADLNVFINLAKKVKPSVVNISIEKNQSQMLQIAPGFYIPHAQPNVVSGSGSGFVIDKTGLIVTNAHVVAGAGVIKVQFEKDKKFYTAKVLGSDRLSDIALLKINKKRSLIPIALGDSQKIQVGEWVVAFGNPHNYGHTMTKGIVSAVKRDIDELNLFPLLQTDASINPGNSGGPLVNLKGEVVGVNNAIAARAQGISFAIPINNVKNILKDLKKYGYVRRGFIGVRFESFPSKKGVLINEVIPNSPADKAGIKSKDVLIRFKNSAIKKSSDLVKYVAKTPIGSKVPITLLRNGKKKKVSIKISSLSEDSFSSPKKPIISGVKIGLGLRVVNSSADIFKKLNLPNIGTKHPIITSVLPSSLAKKAGLKIGDIIFKANNVPVDSVRSLKRSIQSRRSNSFHILRYHEPYDRYLAFIVKVETK